MIDNLLNRNEYTQYPHTRMTHIMIYMCIDPLQNVYAQSFFTCIHTQSATHRATHEHTIAQPHIGTIHLTWVLQMALPTTDWSGIARCLVSSCRAVAEAPWDVISPAPPPLFLLSVLFQDFTMSSLCLWRNTDQSSLPLRSREMSSPYHTLLETIISAFENVLKVPWNLSSAEELFKGPVTTGPSSRAGQASLVT